jgi:ferredoxin
MGTTRYRARVDQQTCIGCGLCEETLPDVFELGAYTASAIDGPVPAQHNDFLAVAVRDCPVGAIVLTPDPADSSREASGYDDEKGENVEERGEIREYQRKHGYAPDGDEVESDDSEGLQRGEHNFSIVRNGTNDN